MKKMNLKRKLKSYLYKKAPTDHEFIVHRYRSVFGKDPDLKNPETFNEKIVWIMANYRDPLYEVCADKVGVRDYIKSKGLERYLTDLYAVYGSVEEVNLDTLPDKFVIKTTHSYGGVCVVSNRSSANVTVIKRKLAKSFSKNLYDLTREWQYKNLLPRIMAEELIEAKGGGPLLDYKFYCFDGEPRFIHISTDIAGGKSYEMDFYDIDWNHLTVQREGRLLGSGVDRPAELDEMLSIARTISKDFPHVRVDLYNVDGRIYIGELTFTTASGTGKFTDEKWDYEFGRYFNLPRSGRDILVERSGVQNEEV